MSLAETILANAERCVHDGENALKMAEEEKDHAKIVRLTAQVERDKMDRDIAKRDAKLREEEGLPL